MNPLDRVEGRLQERLGQQDGQLTGAKPSVPDPKLIISDPDPQFENQEFRIRIQILDPDPSVN